MTIVCHTGISKNLTRQPIPCHRRNKHAPSKNFKNSDAQAHATNECFLSTSLARCIARIATSLPRSPDRRIATNSVILLPHKTTDAHFSLSLSMPNSNHRANPNAQPTNNNDGRRVSTGNSSNNSSNNRNNANNGNNANNANNNNNNPQRNQDYRPLASCPCKILDDDHPVTHSSFIGQNESNRENAFVHALLIDMVASPPNNTHKMRFTSSRNGNTQSRKENSLACRRMCTFADSSNNQGGVFVVFERSSFDSDKHFKHISRPTIGMKVAIIEPSRDERYITEKMPILDTTNPFVPLSAPEIPERPFVRAETKTSKYFIVKNLTLQTDVETIVKTQCTGTMCDRRDPQNICCGCYHNNRNAAKSHVLQLDVSLTGNVTLSLNDWSSLIFTQTVFKGIIPAEVDLGNRRTLKVYRQKIRSLVTCVNTMGGWTVVAWHRLGIKTDGTDTDGKDNKVMSDTPAMHIASSTPTNVTVQDLHNHNHCFETTRF